MSSATAAASAMAHASAATTAPSAATPTRSVPAYGPDPELPEARERAKLEYAKSLCPAAVKQVEGKRLVGCRSCPPFDSSSGPDGRVVVDPEDFWPIEAVVHGSFSRPGADEVAVVMEGCEPHAANYGGTLLAERSGAGWRSLTYASAVHPRDARAFRLATGRDLLLCHFSDVHQMTATDSLYAYDFTLGTPDDPEKGMLSIVGLVDNTLSACFDLSPDMELQRAKIVSFEVSPPRAGKSSGLTVRLLHHRIPYTTALTQRARASCRDDGPEGAPLVDLEQLMGPATSHRLEFSFDGKAFVPLGNTAQTLKRIQSEP